jgi:hypothetical protein
MVLRFHPDGNEVLAAWLESRSPSDDDQRLVAQVLCHIATGRGIRWYQVTDTSDDTITIIEPREGLTVHIRLCADAPDQFELVRILPMTTIEPADLKARDS